MKLHVAKDDGDPQDQSVTQRVAAQIRADVISGVFFPGMPLREAALAESHETSRYTIRAALRDLEREGLLECRRFAGYRVRRLTQADVVDIYDARKTIEIECALRASTNAEIWPQMEDAVATVGRLEAELLSSNNTDMALRQASLEADLAFHSLVVRSARSDRHMIMYDTVRAEIRLCFSLIALYSPPASGNDHALLLQAIRSGDRSAIKREFIRHLNEGLAAILRYTKWGD